jgi:phosphoglycolate phosphatase-like HAD superfamily hydrolase
LKILFWDIDGTLVRTAKAGLYAFRHAAEEMLGRPCNFDGITTAGMTDCYIAAQIILTTTGSEPSAEEIAALVRRYEQLLPGYLDQKQGFAIPPVADILSFLHDDPAYVSLLLTGNTSVGAKAKLARYELLHFFDFSVSAFGDNCQNRSELAIQARTGIQAKFRAEQPLDIYVIGDTPNDIRCGKAIGARTIAVATGTFGVEELASHSPWWAVERLPSPEEFALKLAE